MSLAGERASRGPARSAQSAALAVGAVAAVLGVWGLYHDPRRALIVGAVAAVAILLVAYRRHLAAVRLTPVVWTLLFLLPAAALLGPAAALPQFRNLFLFRVLVVVLIVVLPVWIAVARPRLVLVPRRLYELLAAWLGWLTLTLFWAGDKEAGFRYLGLLLLMLLLMAATAAAGTTARRLRLLLGSLGVVYGLTITVAALETIVAVRLPWARTVGAAKVGVSVTGFFYNANNLATFVAICWPFLLLAIFTPRRRSTLLLGLLGAAGGAWVLFHTGSRTSLAAVAIETVVCVALLAGRRWIRGLRLAVILGVAIVLLGLFGALSVTSSSSRLLGQFRLTNVVTSVESGEGSGGTRRALIEAGVQVSADHLFLGVGPGNAEAEVKAEPGLPVDFGNLHAWWMEVFVVGGLPGFVFFALFYVGMIAALFRVSAAAPPGTVRYAATATLIALVGYVVGSFGPSSVFDFVPMWILFGLGFAVLLRAHRAGRNGGE